LRTEGFPHAAVQATFAFGVVHVQKSEDYPILTVRLKRDAVLRSDDVHADPDAADQLTACGEDHNDRTVCRGIYLHNGALTALMDVTSEFEDDRKFWAIATSPRRSWLRGIEHVQYYPDPESARQRGYVDGDDVYQLIVRGRNGRRLWVAVRADDYDAPGSSQARALLATVVPDFRPASRLWEWLERMRERRNPRPREWTLGNRKTRR
jgi:hypothetical protein